MTTATPQDVIIVGGGAAGLSAAMVLARAHYTVTIVDNNQQSNLVAPEAHAVFTRDNTSPAELYTTARAQLMQYPSVQYIDDTVLTLRKDGVFQAQLQTGTTLSAHTVVLAQGVTYQLPDIPGLQALWGTKVWHCPYCHGYEAFGKKILAIMDAEKTKHMKLFLPKWVEDVAYTDSALALRVDDTPMGVKVTFTNGEVGEFDEILAQTAFVARDKLADDLGCKRDASGAVTVDSMNMTTVDGVYSAGDQSSAMKQVNLAVAAGHIVGTAITLRPR